jgi:hypothetical protein
MTLKISIHDDRVTNFAEHGNKYYDIFTTHYGFAIADH